MLVAIIFYRCGEFIYQIFYFYFVPFAVIVITTLFGQDDNKVLIDPKIFIGKDAFYNLIETIKLWWI